MVDPQRKPSDSSAIERSLQSNTPIPAQQTPNKEQIFRLINKILSFEACLYHQVLPIALEGNCVTLGMVDPEDNTALDYVERLLSYMNYCLVTQRITIEFHREILSAYLNQAGSTKSVTEKLHSIATRHPAAQTAAKPSGEKTARVSPNDQPTFILERKEVLSFKADQAKAQNPSPNPTTSSKAKEDRPHKQSSSQTAQALPALELQTADLSSSVEVLQNLPLKRLLQELLARVLEKGIGRLYFEQKSPQRGRVVCSQDGNLQCVLSDLPMPVFQGLIGELKLLTHLPLAPVQEPKQVEIERFYRQERLLLRLQVTPGAHGEQATLQVLRGAALEFYQQQQLAHLNRDALAIAEQLQQKLDQLRERAKKNASLHSDRYQSLMALDRILENVEQQLEKLKDLPT